MEAEGVSAQKRSLDQAQVEQAINEICHRLDDALRPVLIQILKERQTLGGPAVGTLLGVVAFAASEVALGVQVMAHYGVGRDELAEFCVKNFTQWLFDCLEHNTLELLN